MLLHEVACDVTFLVGPEKEEVQAHKFMLMSRSAILYATLDGQTEPPNEFVIAIPDITADVFRDVLT